MSRRVYTLKRAAPVTQAVGLPKKWLRKAKKMLEWLQDIDWSEVAIVGFFVLLVVALGVLVADMFVTEPYTVQGRLSAQNIHLLRVALVLS